MPILYEDIKFKKGYADNETVPITPNITVIPPPSSTSRDLTLILIGAVGVTAIIIGIVVASNDRGDKKKI